MSVLVGGNFASGGARTGWTVQSASTSLGSRISLGPITGGGVGLVSTTTHADYAATGQLRAELSANPALAVWGRRFRCGWVVALPADWCAYGSEGGQIVLQLHEINAAAVSRRPSFAAEVVDGVLEFILAHDDATGGDVLHHMVMQPGREYEVWVEVKWADGTNEPTANGYLKLWVDGVLVAERTGRNHWATPDPNPPYIKCGIYVPTGTAPWWAGKSRTVHHRGAVMADGEETFADLSALMRTQTVGIAPPAP